MNETVNPDGWPRPSGYSNGVLARGAQLYIAGQVGWDEHGRFPAMDFVSQAKQALRNVRAVLDEAGVSPEHLVRMTWYVTDKRAYNSSLAELGAVYREVIGKHFPAMTAIEVKGLVEDGACVEIEATAVIPDD